MLPLTEGYLSTSAPQVVDDIEYLRPLTTLQLKNEHLCSPTRDRFAFVGHPHIVAVDHNTGRHLGRSATREGRQPAPGRLTRDLQAVQFAHSDVLPWSSRPPMLERSATPR